MADASLNTFESDHIKFGEALAIMMHRYQE
jgi:hypothetical protein